MSKGMVCLLGNFVLGSAGLCALAPGPQKGAFHSADATRLQWSWSLLPIKSLQRQGISSSSLSLQTHRSSGHRALSLRLSPLLSVLFWESTSRGDPRTIAGDLRSAVSARRLIPQKEMRLNLRLAERRRQQRTDPRKPASRMKTTRKIRVRVRKMAFRGQGRQRQQRHLLAMLALLLLLQTKRMRAPCLGGRANQGRRKGGKGPQKRRMRMRVEVRGRAGEMAAAAVTGVTFQTSTHIEPKGRPGPQSPEAR
ncbi:hypothetical protein AGOR_G00219400 [Albula goreensis]|uniref:Uncharacterized protein n=1 Tax=Albula goreensis TaxID=1534307 RepID=A0A8T3CLR4_9TELE|nr:hypothetical protein AGOR_G00219400 [Albula goreensis]